MRASSKATAKGPWTSPFDEQELAGRPGAPFDLVGLVQSLFDLGNRYPADQDGGDPDLLAGVPFIPRIEASQKMVHDVAQIDPGSGQPLTQVVGVHQRRG
jgi:hypothetical protein